MRLSSLFLALYLASSLCVVAAEDFQYVPATLENTTLADGTALKIVTAPPSSPEEITRSAAPAQPNPHWHWRENMGSGAGASRGIFTTAGKRGHDAPMLRTTVTGLKPKTDYQVFGCFWTSGYATDTSVPAGNSAWDIRLGCGISEMMGYGFKTTIGYPVIIQCEKTPPWKDGLRDKDEDKRLLSANLGTVRTDAKGSLIVYVDDEPEDASEARTWYDGIGLLPATAKARIGAGAAGALHRAVRCADWEMVRRELEAGAEINALDPDGLTPLFYACVDPDFKRIEAMLKAGSTPDVEGQSLSPLWVAATAGRADLAALLLKSGAKVPPDPLPANVQRKKFKILARAHPAVAAIGSGSTPVLKLLLEKTPKLDLDRLYASDFDAKPYQEQLTYPYAVMDAVLSKHHEMAECLIDLGCQVKGPEQLPELGPWEKRSETPIGSRRLMIVAAEAGPQMHGVIKALARRGVKLVDDSFAQSRFVLPWDALSAAAVAGDAKLTQLLLSEAGGVGDSYKSNLMVMAQTSGNREVITLVENRFGELRTPQWQGKTVNDQENRIADEARVFELRKVPFTPRSRAKGNLVLAVISDPGSAGPAASLTAKASAGEGWTCVEREQIESLLQESRLAKPWDDAAQDLSSIGDRLAADLLIIVSRLKSKQLTILRLEAVDVRSGIPIDRLHIDEKEFKPDQLCDNYLAGIRRKLEERLAGKALTAVTLLPITVDQSVSGSASLEAMLHAGLLQKIDQTPGTIALTRDQMQPLAEEKTLGQSGKLWGAAWTIEGGLRPLDGNQVELALRVRSLDKDGKAHDVKATGNRDDVHSLVKAVWAQIPAIIKSDLASPTAPTVDTPDQRAGTEAARLMREAEWLHYIKRHHDAASLIDAALYLGADPLKTNLLRMNIHMAKRQYRVWGRYVSSGAEPSQATPDRPLSMVRADEAAHYLGEYLELLRINSESLDRAEKLISDKSNNNTSKGPLYDFLWNLDTLIFYRSVLQPGLMTPANATLLGQFDRELEAHLKRVFALIKPTQQGCNLLRSCNQYVFLNFKAVPALSDALAEAIVRIFDCSDFQGYPIGIFNEFLDRSLSEARREFMPDRLGMICDSLEKAVLKSNSPFKNLRLAELKFLRSSGEQRTVAARELLHTRIAMLSNVRKLFVDWVSAYHLACWSPMPTTDIFFTPALNLYHGDSLIPSLLYTAGRTPDQVFRQSQYTVIAARLYSIKQGKPFASSYSAGWLGEELEVRMSRLVESNEPASEFDDLLSSARLIDRLFGVDVARGLEPKILRVRPTNERRNFGSKNQFPIVAYEGAVEGKVLADLRSGITDKPAMFTHPMVDPKNRHVLWLVLQPYEDWDFKLNEPPTDGMASFFTIEHPWLLAVDCRDGHTIHKIDLAKAAGFSTATARISTFGNPINVGMFANDTHLLLQLFWWPDEAKPSMVSTVLVNRETGAVEKLQDPMRFYHLMMPNSQGSSDAVVGIGDSFFIVQKVESGGTVLWRVRLGQKPVVIAKSGRRPEQSPFDAQDHEVRYINKEGGKLVVASSYGHFGRYDLQSGTWTSDPERNDAQGNGFIDDLDRKQYQATLFPQHLFKQQDGSIEAFGAPWTAHPAQLEFQKGNGAIYYLPVDMKIPDSYRARFQVFSQPPNSSQGRVIAQKEMQYEWVSVADFSRSVFTRPGILNQTDGRFVLGTHIDFAISDHLQKTCYFPFLWAFDKPAMTTGMKKAQHK